MALSRHWKGADRGPSAPGDHRGSAPRQCQVQPSDFLGRWFSSSLAEGRGSLAQKPGWQACRTDGLLTASPSCPLLRILRSGEERAAGLPAHLLPPAFTQSGCISHMDPLPLIFPTHPSPAGLHSPQA